MGMVIGEGAIAKRFDDYSSQSKYLIFVGNIHDSSIQNKRLIRDEELSITCSISEHPNKIFVYFSSCSILDPHVHCTEYVQHKLRMEKLIQLSAQNFLIFRLPQLVGPIDTKSSLINYLVDAVANENFFELWGDAQKNLIDIDDVHTIVCEVLRRNIFLNKVINIANPQKISVLQLVHDIEKFIGRKANFTLVNKGSDMDIDVSEIMPIIEDANLIFGEDYIPNKLSKYYGHMVASTNN